ncbi:MAG: 23S rRNA (pseudouridine(1915)-N(3))-methyltransferase RlmH [Nanoarchaeales archaeon]|nr:23S rRNA (pseudouridine(1915)-N(3))-methyltransferase RlmH [Nanoarchaeales archaeon]
MLKKKEYELLKPHIATSEQIQNTFLLTESGKEYTTFEFDKTLKQLGQNNNGQVIQFIICGAFGPADELRNYIKNYL